MSCKSGGRSTTSTKYSSVAQVKSCLSNPCWQYQPSLLMQGSQPWEIMDENLGKVGVVKLAHGRQPQRRF